MASDGQSSNSLPNMYISATSSYPKKNAKYMPPWKPMGEKYSTPTSNRALWYVAYNSLSNNISLTMLFFFQLKNYAHVLEIILRLRQICCHPNLLTRNRNEKEISELMKNRENLDEETAQKLLSTLADKANEVLLAANYIILLKKANIIYFRRIAVSV